MKKLILLSFILLLFSCSKSIYYEYSNNEKYAILEIENNNIAIYRSTGAKFIYIESAKIFTTTDAKNYIEFSSPYWMYLIEKNENEFNLCGFEYKIREDKYRLVSYQKINEDSIVSISKLNRDQFLKNGSCFTENNIDWLPPYFTRVKKIDYKKFNLPQIEDKYLKDPSKALKVYDK